MKSIVLRLECVKCNCKHQKILAVKRRKILNKEKRRKGQEVQFQATFVTKTKVFFLNMGFNPHLKLQASCSHFHCLGKASGHVDDEGMEGGVAQATPSAVTVTKNHLVSKSQCPVPG